MNRKMVIPCTEQTHKVTVRLESGDRVVISWPRQVNYLKGIRVEIMEGRALLGKHSYRFVRYAE